MQIFLRTELTSFEVELEPETTWNDLKEKILEGLVQAGQGSRDNLDQTWPFITFQGSMIPENQQLDDPFVRNLSQGDIIDVIIPTYFPPRIDFPKLRTVMSRHDGVAISDLSPYQIESSPPIISVPLSPPSVQLYNQYDEQIRLFFQRVIALVDEQEWSSCSCRQYTVSDMANRYDYPEEYNGFAKNNNGPVDYHPETPYREMVWRGPCPHDIICLTVLESKIVYSCQVQDQSVLLGIWYNDRDNLIYPNGFKTDWINLEANLMAGFEPVYLSPYYLKPVDKGAKDIIRLMAGLVPIFLGGNHELDNDVPPSNFHWEEIDFSTDIPDL